MEIAELAMQLQRSVKNYYCPLIYDSCKLSEFRQIFIKNIQCSCYVDILKYGHSADFFVT